MSFMESWKSWSQNQWDSWGSKLGPKYTEVRKWKTPEWAKELFDVIWVELDDELKKKLYKIIFETCKNFDERYAAIILKSIVSAITEILKK